MPVLASALGDATPWLALIGALAVLLVVDVVVLRGKGGELSLRTATVASIAWTLLGLAFTVVLLVFGASGDQANSYLAGYLVERSLSLDNVFVFLLVFTAFGVAAADRSRLLTYGILAALVLRAIFIVVGAALLHSFAWITFIFGALLIWTGWKMLQHRHDHEGEAETVEKIKNRLPASIGVGTAALVSIAIVDIIFAVDSVPAILAITDDTFIVFAANAFALLGLRPLFFLVADLVERLYHLKTALAVLLIFIGIKMGLAEVVGKLPPAASLVAIAVILGTGVIASLVRERRQGGDAPDEASPAEDRETISA